MLVRKRYYFWLLKAYIKRWKRTIFTSLVVGIVLFFASFTTFNFYIKPIFQKQLTKIGYAGVYKIENIPDNILKDVSFGLTQIEENGQIASAAASSWEIKQDGKVYLFHLKKGLYFHDGKELTAYSIPLNFEDVKRGVVDKYTVSYTLKKPYSPFLVSVSRPILLPNLSGLGKYRIKKIELNAGFVKSFVLQNKDNSQIRKNIYFYPSQDSLKTAFALGEIDQATGLTSLTLAPNYDFKAWKNVKIEKKTQVGEMVALFYNTTHSSLSNKKFRQALNYALPEKVPFGLRAFSPFHPNNIYFSTPPNYGIADMEIAKQLLSGVDLDSKEIIEISTTQEYEDVAKQVAQSWSRLGVKVEIKLVDGIPTAFEVFLHEIKLPQDPDQYTLWHSDQINNDNITHFKNLRIDKLLEDGRVTTETDKRMQIYADFQKYMLDEVPASFFYFPYSYTLVRK